MANNKSDDVEPAVDPLLMKDHEYDGIQELDNPLPQWWKLTFYGTIIFSVFYFGYYVVGSGPTLTQEFQAEYASHQTQFAAAAANVPLEKLNQASGNAERMKAGSSVYVAKCAVCHGQEGQGVIGPNLTDDYWIHGQGDLEAIYVNVRDGVLDKGMPNWGPLLTPDELIDVVAYVKSLQGTTPPNPKPPQGEKRGGEKSS